MQTNFTAFVTSFMNIPKYGLSCTDLSFVDEEESVSSATFSNDGFAFVEEILKQPNATSNWHIKNKYDDHNIDSTLETKQNKSLKQIIQHTQREVNTSLDIPKQNQQSTTTSLTPGHNNQRLTHHRADSILLWSSHK